MARLTTAVRNRIPLAQFALKKSPSGKAKGGYPVDTPGRAVAAKGRATQAVNAGRMSRGTEQQVDAKANAALRRFKRGGS